jgi:mannose-6-phosphate isomerase-like protein (cupin superfamily)
MKNNLFLVAISFITGIILTVIVFYLIPKKSLTAKLPDVTSGVADKNAKVLFSTIETEDYYFPTHGNSLIMDRSNSEVSESFIVNIAPGRNTHKHVHHDTEQVFYVLFGKGRVELEREGKMEKFDIEPKNVVFIPRHSYHQIFSTSADTLHYIAVDCFPMGRNPLEPTWDSHVQVMCKDMGWDYSTVRTRH